MKQEDNEKCQNCRSYSGPKQGKGWCMKLRKSTSSCGWCGYHN